MNIGDLNWIASLNDSEFQTSLNRMDRNINRTSNNIMQRGNDIESFAKKAASAAAAFFSVQAAEGFVSSLIEVRSQFQQLDIAFSTMLKSKAAADALMKDLVNFASTTPYGLKDAAGAAKQLLAYGSTAKSVVGELRMLGDVAAGVSAPIGDLVYLYGTLKTQGRAYAMDIRQFAGRGIPIYAELAKVLKVNKDEVSAFVEAGKVGFPEIEQAFKNMTAAGSMFGGLMEEQSKAWSGQIERFKDAWDVMLNEIGESQEGLFAEVIGGITEMVENYERVLEILGLMIYSYGAYRAALIAFSVAQAYATASVVTFGVSVRQLTVMETLLAASKRVLISLQATYNAVLAASPIGATVALLAALGAVIYSLTQYTSAAEATQERFNKIQSEGGLSAAKEANNIRALVDVIKSQTASTEQRAAAYKKLQETTKGVLVGFSQEEIAAGKAKSAIDAYVQSIREAAVARKAFSEFQKLNDQLADLEVNGAKSISMMDKAALRAKALGTYLRLGAATGFPGADNPMIGLSKETIKQYKDAQRLVMGEWGENADNILVGKTKEKLQKELDNLSKKFGNQITGELTKGTGAEEVVVASKKRTVDVIDAEIKKLKDEQSAVSESSAQWSNYAAQIKKLEAEKSKITGKAAASIRTEESALKRYAEMMQKIYDLNEKYNNKSLTDDEQKLAQIRADYKALQDDIDLYNKDSRNKKINRNLKPALEKAIANQEYENDTERLKTELDKQKQLYDDFEAYRIQVGDTAAKTRYQNEIDTTVSLLQKLESERAKLLDKDPTLMSGPERKRLEDLDARINEEVKVERKKYDDLVAEFTDYAEKRKALGEKYEKDIAALSSNPAAQAERTRRYQEDLDSLDDANVQKLDAYKALFKGIETISDDHARKVISNAKLMLQTLVGQGAISKELAEQIAKLIRETSLSLKDRMPDRIIKLANDIDRVAEAVGGVDNAFGKVLSTLGNIVGQVGNIKKGLADFKTAEGSGDLLGQLGAGLGIFGAGFSIVKSIAGIFDKSAEREAQAAAARESQIKQTEAISKALERQITLINDAYGTERIERYQAAIKKATEDEATYRKMLSGRFLLTKESEKADQSIERGNVSGFSQSDIDWLTKVGVQRLTGAETLEELNRILYSGKLDEATAKIVQGLIDVEKQATETKNALNAETIGSSLDVIADDFVKNLTDGTEDFGKTFEDIIRNSIVNGFKGKLIQQQLQGFYTQFAEATSDGNLTSDEISKLREAYLAASEKAKADFDALSKATGIDLTGSDANESALSKSIKGISSDQANALEGIMRAQYGLQKQTVEQALISNSFLSGIGQNSLQLLEVGKRNLAYQQQIVENTANTVQRLDMAVSELKAINSNTKASGKGVDLRDIFKSGGLA